MATTIAAASAKQATERAILWILRGLEVSWLLTVILVPLAFVGRESILSESELAYVDVPKTVLLRAMAGLMASLWLAEWALQHWINPAQSATGRQGLFQPAAWIGSLGGWLRQQPTRWVNLAVLLYFASVLASTALSESFSVSMWGLVPGQDTYPAYTITCYVVFFGVVATHLRTKPQVERFLWAIASMGVVVGGYAWAQFFGHDVFNLREIPGARQSGSTLGNPILAGSLLLMSITVSLTAANSALSETVRSGSFRVKLVLWTLILTVQMTGLIFASSRGPWGGIIVALTASIVLLAVFAGWRSLARMALVLGLAGSLTVAIVFVPPPFPTGEPIMAPAGAGGLYEIAPPAEASSLAAATSSRIISIRHEVGGGGLSSRIGIWEVSGRLIQQRPWFEFESRGIPILRHLVGYGPDMFKYSFLLERRPDGRGQGFNSERFAHNIFIHQGVEVGILGLLATLGLFAAPTILGGYQLFRQRNGDSTFFRLVIIGVIAALSGRFSEQMVGVAAVADITLFWALLALFAALPAAIGITQPIPNPVPNNRQEQRSQHRSPQTVRNRRYGAQTLLPLGVAICLITFIGILTWYKSVNYLVAGFEAREALDSIRDTRLPTALNSIDRAIDLAPDVSVYHTLRSAVYQAYRRQNDGAGELECSDIPRYQRCLLGKIYLSNLEAAEKRPYDWRASLILADSALTIGLVDKDPNLTGEAIGLYRKVAQLAPQTSTHWDWLGAAQIKAGRYGEALESLSRSLSILDGIPMAAHNRVLHGMALLELDNPRLALSSFNAAIRLDPDLADAYINRGASYNILGQYQRAIQDLDKAIELNPEMVMAYNNRGNSYGNLNQFQRAIQDYDETIRLDPRFALAYSNRALAYTYIGRDDDARIDVRSVAKLGVDPGPLLAMIEEVKAGR